ncbi:hypothetical protein HELRODRAFT_183318 [Helobdella robusta]|uniref:WH2 domain-containing protein n=1 Tax=Helobdella robusta TaxID=6412 RepID=T1FJG2_HELRO|nr:hypothetical protein HELRODRAFT_183318 [Helobdella robusta]ESO11306.1 hypothetical protein HELRODRAFT_183318 [Helobdella robusta]
MNYISHYVPPPPPGSDVIQLPVSGLTLEVDHAEKRNNLLESIRGAGGFQQARLKHVPEEHQHVPGKARPIMPSSQPTGSASKNKMAAGRGDLMNDLNAVLHNRKLGRGMGKKQFICHVPLMGPVRGQDQSHDAKESQPMTSQTHVTAHSHAGHHQPTAADHESTDF